MQTVFTRRHAMALGLTGVFAATVPASANVLSYQLRPEDAEIAFTFSAGGVSLRGTAPLQSADIVVDTARLDRSSADVIANVAQARTGIGPATTAMRSTEVLDTARFPSARFRSTGVELGRDGRISSGAVILGDLTLRGVTRPVRLAATLSRPAGTAPDDLRILSVRLTGALDRTGFGATGYANLVDATVQLDIRATLSAV